MSWRSLGMSGRLSEVWGNGVRCEEHQRKLMERDGARRSMSGNWKGESGKSSTTELYCGGGLYTTVYSSPSAHDSSIFAAAVIHFAEFGFSSSQVQKIPSAKRCHQTRAVK